MASAAAVARPNTAIDGSNSKDPDGHAREAIESASKSEAAEIDRHNTSIADTTKSVLPSERPLKTQTAGTGPSWFSVLQKTLGFGGLPAVQYAPVMTEPFEHAASDVATDDEDEPTADEDEEHEIDPDSLGSKRTSSGYQSVPQMNRHDDRDQDDSSQDIIPSMSDNGRCADNSAERLAKNRRRSGSMQAQFDASNADGAHSTTGGLLDDYDSPQSRQTTSAK